MIYKSPQTKKSQNFVTQNITLPSYTKNVEKNLYFVLKKFPNLTRKVVATTIEVQLITTSRAVFAESLYKNQPNKH